MSLFTLLGYLVGLRWAVEEVAADPWAVWVGLALVVSTGLARGWDTRDLLRQPWHLVLPLGVASALALALAALLFLVLTEKKAGTPPFVGAYRSLLSLILLTAPLAWLYAVPFQRFLDARRAVHARLIVLGVVATWRVALLSRAVAVLLDGRGLAAFLVVILVADAGALAGLLPTALVKLSLEERRGRERFTPTLLGMMGGVEARTTPVEERERLLFVTGVVAVLGVVALPVWIFGILKTEFSAARWRELLAGPGPWDAPDAGPWLLAAGAVFFFLGLLLWGQPAQRRGTRVERLLTKGEVKAALAELSAWPRCAFPPHWSPPPAEEFRARPSLIDVVEAVAAGPVAPWVRATYLERFREYLGEPLWYWFYDAELGRVAAVLERLPEGPEFARHLREAVQTWEARRGDELSLLRLGDEETPPPPHPAGLWARYRKRLDPEPEPSTDGRVETVEAIWRLADHAAAGT